MDNRATQKDQRMSRAEKEANEKSWYKQKIRLLDTHSNRTAYGFGGVSEYHRMKVNYDLFNNIIDLRDFEYVCKPFGAETGELPAKMVNRDILSNKIKVILGMEMKRPFDYKVVAINSEATTRKEQEEFKRLKDYVVNSIVAPLRKQLEVQSQQENQGKELTPEQKQQIEKQIDEQLKTMTPEEVKVYMERDHQDPAEIMCHQLLTYLVQKRDIKRKFSNGTKHAALTAKEIYWVGEVNNEPDVRVCDPLRFNYDKSPDLEFIEDGEWATYEYRMTPSEVIGFFADELDKEEIDTIYKDYSSYVQDRVVQDMFDFSRIYNKEENHTVRVFHAVWKSLREIKFLTYTDENGEIQETVVDELYKLDKENGDISITSEWIPECYEGYKIGADIFKKCRPVPGQFKDIDNIYVCKLPYYGSVYDSTNSVPTSIMDRGKVWQYYLNIIMYRLEMMMASDKGKKVLMNINAVPDSAGIDIEKFQYFFESSPFGWFNPNEEGVGYQDVNAIAKVIDLSMASDMAKYIDLANKIKEECGEAMGISRQMEAQIGQYEGKANTQQAIIQNTYILEPFFNLHNCIKRNVLTALLECAKVCYSTSKAKKLTYVLDDMSLQTLNLDTALLDNTTLGLFVSDSSKAAEVKDLITNLAHAALQNQQIKLSDVLSVIKEDSITVAEEVLKKSEKEQQEFMSQQQERQLQSEEQRQQALAETEQRKWEHEKEMIVLKEEEKRKTVIAQSSIMAASFNPDEDKDNNGINDFLQLAKHDLDVNIKKRKQDLEEKKFQEKSIHDAEKLKLEKKKLFQKSNSK